MRFTIRSSRNFAQLFQTDSSRQRIGTQTRTHQPYRIDLTRLFVSILSLRRQSSLLSRALPAPSGKHPKPIAPSSYEKHPSAFRSHQFR
jgi:hypothetical protein